jgi:hypothetical protein
MVITVVVKTFRRVSHTITDIHDDFRIATQQIYLNIQSGKGKTHSLLHTNYRKDRVLIRRTKVYLSYSIY